MGKIRVLLADDHAVVREGLKSLINAQEGLEVVGEADNGLAAALLATELDPDVVIADLSMPGLNGAQLAARLREIRPGQKVLALTVHEDRAYLRMVTGAGAAGYVLKRAAYRTMSTRLCMSSFSIDRVLYVSTVLMLTPSWAAISLLE